MALIRDTIQMFFVILKTLLIKDLINSNIYFNQRDSFQINQ